MISKRMSLAATRDFCHRFGTGLGAGADLLRLLDSESKIGSPAQREAIRYMRTAAADGENLATAMQQRDHVFPPLLISMTRLGEATGRMERTMLKVAEHYAQAVKLRNNFQQALIWPMLQLIIGIGVISLLILIMGLVTTSAGGEMADMLGLGLRGPSGVLTFWAFIAVFVLGIFLVWTGFKRNWGGVQNLVPLFYRIPVMGEALQTITLSRFAWTLALGLDAGLEPISTIKLALDSTDSNFYQSGAQDAEDAIRGGSTLAEGLRATHVFPEYFLTQVEVAELSGTDAESIDRVAREYDARAQTAMKTISGIATGLIWLFVSCLLIFMIFRIVMNIAGVYSEALEGI